MAQDPGAAADSGQSRPPERENRGVHNKYIYLSQLDSQLNMLRMKKNALPALERQYDQLRQSLAKIGYISQGSVLNRSTLKNPRSGYQWTRKLARKTITLALSHDQFQALRQAIKNRKNLAQVIAKMESLSRQILFATRTDTRRRKPLSRKVLGLN
jgi:virulence-associated protein VapD